MCGKHSHRVNTRALQSGRRMCIERLEARQLLCKLVHAGSPPAGGTESVPAWPSASNVLAIPILFSGQTPEAPLTAVPMSRLGAYIGREFGRYSYGRMTVSVTNTPLVTLSQDSGSYARWSDVFAEARQLASAANGMPAQGNDDPLSEFGNHYLVEFQAGDEHFLYDPSYGTEPVSRKPGLGQEIEFSLQRWEANALDGVAKKVQDLTGDGQPDWIARKKTPANLLVKVKT
jgi:hypothetical protein